MNYIKLLNAAFEKFFFDDRLNPTHISLYMALFQEWNSSRFAVGFYVNRRDLMMASKIGSKSTYHRCITDLDTWRYLSYFPSNNPYKGSKIKMSIFSTSEEPDMEGYDPELEQLAEHYHPTNGQVENPNRPFSGQALVSNINNTKQVKSNKKPKGWQAVFNFFKEKGYDTVEGKKFYTYYETNGWKTSDEKPIRDWKALAKNWIDRTELFAKKNKSNKNPQSYKQDNLRTTKNKDYGQPL